jgi:hypothetical protein
MLFTHMRAESPIVNSTPTALYAVLKELRQYANMKSQRSEGEVGLTWKGGMIR